MYKLEEILYSIPRSSARGKIMTSSPLFDQLSAVLLENGNWKLDPISPENECLTTEGIAETGFDIFIDENQEISLGLGGEELLTLTSTTLPEILLEIEKHMFEYTNYVNSLPEPSPI